MVLHRPVELAAETVQVGFSTKMDGPPTNQELAILPSFWPHHQQGSEFDVHTVRQHKLHVDSTFQRRVDAFD
jgi:hypothetical protein